MNKSADESLALLHQDHENLFVLFESHQRALLARDIDNAAAIFSEFHEFLLTHIRFEEHYLLPKYALEGAETAGGTLAIFQAEHQKLRAMADKVAEDTLALFTAADVDAQIIAIFDQEALFKGLLTHHAQREENILVPGLEARTTAAERQQLLEKHAQIKPFQAIAG